MSRGEAYSGIENLEVMQEAENYNRYLLHAIRSFAPKCGRVLDFGAGSGEFAHPMAASGFDLTALEPDATLASILRGKRISTVTTMQDLPDNSFDYAYSLNVLEHIDDDISALRQLRLKLKKGARLFVYVPAFPILFTRMDERVGHVRRYTRRRLTSVIAECGLRIERVAFVDSVGFFATLAFKLIGSEDGTINRTALKLYDRFVFPLSRALDLITHPWFGKNLLIVAVNDDSLIS